MIGIRFFAVSVCCGNAIPTAIRSTQGGPADDEAIVLATIRQGYCPGGELRDRCAGDGLISARHGHSFQRPVADIAPNAMMAGFLDLMPVALMDCEFSISGCRPRQAFPVTLGEFQATLRVWEMRSSMSIKAICGKNAPSERVWGGMKTASLPRSEIRHPTRSGPRRN